MASRYPITILVLAGLLLFGGLVLAQDTESAEEVEAAPGEQAAGGDAESEEGGAAAAPVGTGENADGTDGGTAMQGNNPFFGTGDQQAEEPDNAAVTGDADAESNEAGGTALETTGNTEQNEAEEEEAEAAEVAEEEEVDFIEEAENTIVPSPGPMFPLFNMNMGQQNGQEPAEQGEEGGDEMESGEEVEVEEAGAQEVDPVEEAENTMKPAKSSGTFFNINNPQEQAGQAEEVEMESGEAQGAAEMGGDADESGEEAEAGAVGGAQNADGDNAESGEEEGEVEEEQGSSTSSVGGGGPSPSPGAPLIDVDIEEEEEVEVEEEEPFEKPNLFSNPLSDKAKQVATGETTVKPEDTTPTPDTGEEEKQEEPSGLSDSDKTRIIISTSAVGAVVFVGVVAYFIGRNVSRRPHVGANV